MVEFVNRMITGARVGGRDRWRCSARCCATPRRRDLTWLSLGLVAGVVGQIVLGGIVVLFDLRRRGW